MRNIVLIVALVLSVSVYAETWKWNTTVESVRSFNGSSLVCFGAEGVDRSYICFDAGKAGGKEKLSMLLAAKMSDAVVHVSYKEPGGGETVLWLEHNEFYWSHHFTIR